MRKVLLVPEAHTLTCACYSWEWSSLRHHLKSNQFCVRLGLPRPRGAHPAKVSHCVCNRRCVFGLVHDVSLVLIDRSATLVEPSFRFGFCLHACGCHAREAHRRRFLTGTAHDTSGVRPCVRGSQCRTVRSSLPSLHSSCLADALAVLIVHSCSDILAVLIVLSSLLELVDLFVVRTVKEDPATSHHQCLLLLPSADRLRENSFDNVVHIFMASVVR